MDRKSRNQNGVPISPTFSSEILKKINTYRRAANYYSVGQIYLYDNPLLKETLKHSHG